MDKDGAINIIEFILRLFPNSDQRYIVNGLFDFVNGQS